jgi:hypothetical protein
VDAFEKGEIRTERTVLSEKMVFKYVSKDTALNVSLVCSEHLGGFGQYIYLEGGRKMPNKSKPRTL